MSVVESEIVVLEHDVEVEKKRIRELDEQLGITQPTQLNEDSDNTSNSYSQPETVS